MDFFDNVREREVGKILRESEKLADRHHGLTKHDKKHIFNELDKLDDDLDMRNAAMRQQLLRQRSLLDHLREHAYLKEFKEKIDFETHRKFVRFKMAEALLFGTNIRKIDNDDAKVDLNSVGDSQLDAMRYQFTDSLISAYIKKAQCVIISKLPYLMLDLRHAGTDKALVNVSLASGKVAHALCLPFSVGDEKYGQAGSFLIKIGFLSLADQLCDLLKTDDFNNYVVNELVGIGLAINIGGQGFLSEKFLSNGLPFGWSKYNDVYLDGEFDFDSYLTSQKLYNRSSVKYLDDSRKDYNSFGNKSYFYELDRQIRDQSFDFVDCGNLIHGYFRKHQNKMNMVVSGIDFFNATSLELVPKNGLKKSVYSLPYSDDLLIDDFFNEIHVSGNTKVAELISEFVERELGSDYILEDGVGFIIGKTSSGEITIVHDKSISHQQNIAYLNAKKNAILNYPKGTQAKILKKRGFNSFDVIKMFSEVSSI